jgi:hypothetical protein
MNDLHAEMHANDKSRLSHLSQESDKIKVALEQEQSAHGHAVQQYVNALEYQGKLHNQIAEERTAKQSALRMLQRSEGRATFLAVRIKLLGLLLVIPSNHDTLRSTAMPSVQIASVNCSIMSGMLISAPERVAGTVRASADYDRRHGAEDNQNADNAGHGTRNQFSE